MKEERYGNAGRGATVLLLKITRTNQTFALQALRLARISRKEKRRSSDHRSLEFQAHPELESQSEFSLTLHWNEKSISGSFLDWKMLSHFEHRVRDIEMAIRSFPFFVPFI